MTDYNTQALARYQAEIDRQEREEEYREQCKKRAYKYFAGKLGSINGSNLGDCVFSLGGKARYSFTELLFDYLGDSPEIDAAFGAMLNTKQGLEFLDEFARLLGDKHDEVGEL